MALHVVARSGCADPHSNAGDEVIGPAPLDRESPDEFVARLNGQELAVFTRRWRLEVFSVLESEGRQYAQLALRGPVDHMLTLRMRSGLPAGQVLPRLLDWLSRPGPSGQLLDLT